MKKALPGKKVGDIWKELTAKARAFKKLGDARLSKVDRYDIVTIRCEFAKTAYDARVVFDADKRITGLFFQQAFEYKAPAYVNRDAFTERDLQVGAGEWALPGTLALPKGDGPFRAVVLLHGSGPHDRDETIGPNKPFRDLAEILRSFRRLIDSCYYDHQIVKHITDGSSFVSPRKRPHLPMETAPSPPADDDEPRTLRFEYRKPTT